MRNIYILFVLLNMMAMPSCSTKLCDKVNNPDTKSVFFKCAEKTFEITPWCSFHVRIDDYENGRVVASNGAVVSYYHDDTSSTLFLHLDDSYSYAKTNKLEVVKVDYANKDFLSFNKANSEQLYWNQRLDVESKMGYLPFFFQSVMSDLLPIEKLSIHEYCDTVVRSVSSMVFKGISPEYKSTNCVTGETRTKQYECYYWVNKTKSMLDSLIVRNNQSDDYSVYIVESLHQDNMASYYDSIFNCDMRSCEGFAMIDENSWLDVGNETETPLTDWEEYPIVNLKGDTVFLSEMDGWLLLNLWCFNCPTCIKELKEWGEEKDSLGYRPLMRNGIKILSLNYKSDNFDLLNQMASQTNSDDILFSAKGIDRFFQLPYLGYNYLFSPAKEIVYQSPYIGNNGDYSELLEAKANYEKQHKNK